MTMIPLYGIMVDLRGASGASRFHFLTFVVFALFGGCLDYCVCACASWLGRWWFALQLRVVGAHYL